MRPRSAVELVRFMLKDCFPDATEQGLDDAARYLVRWGSDGVGDHLGPESTWMMIADLESVLGAGFAEPVEPRPEFRWNPRLRSWQRPNQTMD
ncbi:hypothetical protein AB0F13_24545 [Streptomyces sp. NPDC026206]|uniref:hypothetical protein n=1 Tax=Streptomyces sp. NPDC026206 TaxID=3157089 RepID=UPI0033D0CBCD